MEIKATSQTPYICLTFFFSPSYSKIIKNNKEKKIKFIITIFLNLKFFFEWLFQKIYINKEKKLRVQVSGRDTFF